MPDRPLRSASWLFLLASLLPAIVAAETVRLCDSKNPPYVLGEENGSPATGGLAVEVAERVFARLPEVELEVVLYPWSRCLQLARDGEVDGVLKLLYREERAKYLDFTTQAIYRMEMSMFHRRDQFPDGLAWSSLSDLAPYTLGVVQSSSNGPLIDDAIATGVLKAETVAEEAMNVRKLAAGRIDMFPNDRVMGLANVRELGFEDEIVPSQQSLGSDDILLGLSKKSPARELLPEIDRALEALWKEGEIDRILGHLR